VLAWVGAHPHVVRLLEAFQGKEDVLVLEYCELGDMYEFYVRTGKAGIPEEHGAELARQVLLALGHLVARRVEHRDVKPENLMLYRPADGLDVPMLKLGDFGWATICFWNEQKPHIPAEGCGSLWYAPPELNPPTPGVDAPAFDPRESPLGSCDMWSLGVITYLLLCGHSPFNTSLRIRDPAEREFNILRLASLGQINEKSQSWQKLPTRAQSFCLGLMKPVPGARLNIQEALAHPFIRKALRAPRCAAVQDVHIPVSMLGSSSRRSAWDALDGLQRLSWLAIAAAITEPEVIAGHIVQLDEVLVRLQGMLGDASYVEELAVELASVAKPALFRRLPSSWSEVVHLAFRYLDVGMDGLLGVDDLSHHVLGDGVADTVHGWVRKWRRQGEDGLGYEDFCNLLEQSIAARGNGRIEGLGGLKLLPRGVEAGQLHLDAQDEHASFFESHPEAAAQTEAGSIHSSDASGDGEYL